MWLCSDLFFSAVVHVLCDRFGGDGDADCVLPRRAETIPIELSANACRRLVYVGRTAYARWVKVPVLGVS
jgi:hypothetical protein